MYEGSSISSYRHIDEGRRNEILQKLQQERELRRDYVRQGREDEFVLQDFTSD